MSGARENVVVDLDQYMGPFKRQPSKTPADPLDAALLEQDAQLARDVKRTQLKRVMAEETNRLKELEDKMGDGEEKTAKQAEGPEVDPRVFKMIADLPEEQQEKALQVYTTMVAARGARGEAAYMPLILGTMSARPNSNATDIVDSVTKIMGLVESAKAPATSGSGDRAVEALVTLATREQPGKTGETAQLITAIAEVVRQGQNTAPAADPVATAIGMIRDLKDLGLMGGQQPVPSGHSDEVNIRLAEIKRDTDIKLAELGLNKEVSMAKVANDKARTDALGGLVERAAKVAGRAFGEGETEAGGNAAAQSAPAANIAQTECPSCKKTIGIPDPTKARQVVCPHCSAVLQWDGKP